MENTNIRVVPAKEKDHQFIAKVCWDAESLYQPFLPGFFDQQGKMFAEQGLIKGYDFHLIYSHEQPIGFFCTRMINEEINYTVMFFLLNEYQNKGYGSKALKVLEDHLKRQGIKTMSLYAHNQAYWAVNFYLKNDFTKIGETEQEVKEYKDGILLPYRLMEDLILLAKEI